jgi:lysophospholipase L1-like esterase
MSVVRRVRCPAWLAVATFAVATVLLWLPSGAVAATLSYAALGDSYSSGVGADDYDPDSGSCKRSSHAYPVLWVAEHPSSDFDFVACGGATTDTVRESQLAVLNAGTGLVTISIGGNDVGFAGLMISCRLGSESACSDAVADAERQAQTTLPAKLAATFSEIKDKAPRARLIVLGYPRLFETTDCGSFGMSVANRTRLNQGADALEAAIEEQAETAGGTYVSVNAQFEGHRVCAAQPWINGLGLAVSNSYHPTAEGYAQGYFSALTEVAAGPRWRGDHGYGLTPVTGGLR